MAEGHIDVKLSKDEALILFEWLAHFDETETLPTRDESEQKVLWLLEGKLEKKLTEPLLPDYLDRVKEAKKRILDS